MMNQLRNWINDFEYCWYGPKETGPWIEGLYVKHTIWTVDFRFLGPVVQTLDNAIHRINHYPVDSAVCFANTYPLDSDLSGG